MGRLAKFGSVALVGALSLASTGCIQKVLIAGQIDGTLKGATAVSTVSDFEVARTASYNGLAKAEGMHYLQPSVESALFLLTKSWASAGFAFMEDDMQIAEDTHGEDSEMANYHRARAASAYSRAIFYGSKAMNLRHPGFKEAQKNAATIKAYAAQFTDAEEDTPLLFWVAQAWLSRVNLLKDQPDVVADLFVGVALIERAVELDETYNYAAGHTILGSYHARTAMAEMDDAKKHFERALELTGGKTMLPKLNFAAKYYCKKVDKENYVKLIKEVIAAGDTLPAQRLQNTIAKRRARRLLLKRRMQECGFD